jgi:hypothetical protein
MTFDPNIDQLRYLTTTTASLFGLYSIVVALIIQFEREKKFLGTYFRLVVCVPILLLGISFVAGLKTIYFSWLWNTVAWSGRWVAVGMVMADTVAVSWIAIALLVLIFKVGRGQ